LLTNYSFPYPDKDPQAYAAVFKSLYTLVWDGVPLGLMLSSVVERLEQVPVSIRGEIEVKHSSRTVSAFRAFPTEAERSRAVAATTAYWRDNKVFDILAGWRNELYPVYGPGNELLFSIERAASCLFGFVTYGVHMTAYVKDESASYGMKLWIPKRAKGKQTYPSAYPLLLWRGQFQAIGLSGGMYLPYSLQYFFDDQPTTYASLPRHARQSGGRRHSDGRRAV
jgi:hypothetical protein